VSRLGEREDARLHYSNGDHNWTPPPGVDVEVWRAAVAAHKDAHCNAGPRDELPEWHPGDGLPTPPNDELAR
jgi:hypothetical protein